MEMLKTPNHLKVDGMNRYMVNVPFDRATNGRVYRELRENGYTERRTVIVKTTERRFKRTKNRAVHAAWISQTMGEGTYILTFIGTQREFDKMIVEHNS